MMEKKPIWNSLKWQHVFTHWSLSQAHSSSLIDASGTHISSIIDASD